jgi:hypothetical protein
MLCIMCQQSSSLVGRMKTNAVYVVIESQDVAGDGILVDEVIRFTADKAKKHCPIALRRIIFRRKQDQKVLVLSATI